MQETQVQSLIWEEPMCHGSAKPMPLTTVELHKGSLVAMSLRTAAGEQTLLTATREKPTQ